jgi:hypothetical protein
MMPLSYRLVVVLVAALPATVVTISGAREPGSAPAASAQDQDVGPRNPAGEAATGDTEAMLAVVQEVVDCLRSKGLDPGDPEVQGKNVVIADWNPVWDSPDGRADRECFFPVR